MNTNRTSQAVDRLQELHAWCDENGTTASDAFQFYEEFPAIAQKYKRMEDNLVIACDLLDVRGLHTDAEGLRQALHFDTLSTPAVTPSEQ